MPCLSAAKLAIFLSTAKFSAFFIFFMFCHGVQSKRWRLRNAPSWLLSVAVTGFSEASGGGLMMVRDE